jgi:hypothetical protein
MFKEKILKTKKIEFQNNEEEEDTEEIMKEDK